MDAAQLCPTPLRALLFLQATALIVGVGCDNRVGGGRVLSVDDRPRSDAGVFQPTFDAEVSDAAPATDGGSEPADAGVVTHPLPHGAVGTSCADGQTRTFFILSAEPLDCAALGDILRDGPDGQEVAYTELSDLTSLGPRRLDMQVCLSGGPCQTRSLEINVGEIGEGQSLVGRWNMDLDGVRAEGNVDASWCNFDSAQPGGALATGLSMTEVSIYQSVKVTLMTNGMPVSPNAPVVGGRPALVRVFVAPQGGFDARDIVARLRIEAPNQSPVELEETIRVSATSAEDRPDTTFNFDVPATALVLDASFSVGLYEVEACGAGNPDPNGVLYPTSGVALLDPRPTGGPIRVIVVPVRYDADGSGRLPDTSPAQIDRLRDTMFKLYPVPEVDITVREPLEWSGAILRNGAGWGEILQAVQGLRSIDQPPNNTYYYGIFRPADSFSAFCGGGCVAGLGTVPGPNSVQGRGSVGLGFTGQSAAETFVHEVGHNLGRSHAPCQVNNADPAYPYSSGRLGVWGFDLLDRTLIEPNEHRDMMGYCDPIWISDYTYDAIFTRIARVNGAQPFAPWPDREVDVLFDDMDGVRWGDRLVLSTPMGADRVPVKFVDGLGEVLREDEAEQLRYDHLPGRYLLIPRRPDGAVAVQVPDVGRVAF